jgi:hypothetical protein
MHLLLSLLLCGNIGQDLAVGLQLCLYDDPQRTDAVWLRRRCKLRGVERFLEVSSNLNFCYDY